MKRLRLFLASASYLVALAITPLLSFGYAHAAQTTPLECANKDGEFVTRSSQGCDLSVDKQVSVNSGAYVEADVSANAAKAHVGDTITWKITVSNTSSDPSTMTPWGKVTVNDVLPSGVTFVSAVASVGTYTSNDWAIPLNAANLPATLTITTTASATGLQQNTAVLSDYDPCGDGCLGNVGSYQDSNNANNSNDAWANVETAPKVLAASTTAPNTGFGSPLSNSPALALIGIGIIGFTAGLVIRKKLV